MVDQQPPHQKAGEPEKFHLFVAGGIAAFERFDLEQFQVEFVYQHGGLPGMITALTAHFYGGQTPQFRIEQVEKLTRGLMIAGSQLGHELGYSLSDGFHGPFIVTRGWRLPV